MSYSIIVLNTNQIHNSMRVFVTNTCNIITIY